MEATINIDDYLSEQEKKELAIEVFKERISSEMFKSSKGSIDSDSEIQRIIGNISHEIVMNEVQKHIPDFEKLITKKVSKIITENDLSYQVFKKKSAWDKDESLAVTYMQQTIIENRDLFKGRIKQAMENYDLSKDLSEQVTSEFEKMAGSFYKLAEYFQKRD